MGKKPGTRSQEKLWQQAEHRFAASEKLGEAGRLDEACTGFAEASQLFRQAGDDSAAALCIYTALEDRARMVDLNASLAIAAVSLQDDRAAIEFLKTAHVIDQELGGAHAAQIKTMLQEVGTFAQPKRKSRGKASRTG